MIRVAIVVGAQGRGSNMRALATQIQASPDMEVSCVISPKAESGAVDTARSLGLNVIHVPYGDNFEAGLSDALVDTDWICLAGFMRLFPLSILDRFTGRVLNIHPALLPKFGGKGMYGMHVHTAVIDSGETESGCTIHYVTPVYDEGAIVHQKRCPVEPGDTPESLGARVLQLEHQAYFEALQIAIKNHG